MHFFITKNKFYNINDNIKKNLGIERPRLTPERTEQLEQDLADQLTRQCTVAASLTVPGDCPCDLPLNTVVEEGFVLLGPVTIHMSTCQNICEDGDIFNSIKILMKYF